MELLVNIIFSISVHAQGYFSALCRHMLREASQQTLAPNLCLQQFPKHNVKVTPLQGKSDHVPCILRIFQEVCIAYWIKHKHFGTAVRSSPPWPLLISQCHHLPHSPFIRTPAVPSCSRLLIAWGPFHASLSPHHLAPLLELPSFPHPSGNAQFSSHPSQSITFLWCLRQDALFQTVLETYMYVYCCLYHSMLFQLLAYLSSTLDCELIAYCR